MARQPIGTSVGYSSSSLTSSILLGIVWPAPRSVDLLCAATSRGHHIQQDPHPAAQRSRQRLESRALSDASRHLARSLRFCECFAAREAVDLSARGSSPPRLLAPALRGFPSADTTKRRVHQPHVGAPVDPRRPKSERARHVRARRWTASRAWPIPRAARRHQCSTSEREHGGILSVGTPAAPHKILLVRSGLGPVRSILLFTVEGESVHPPSKRGYSAASHRARCTACEFRRAARLRPAPPARSTRRSASSRLHH